MSTKKTQAQAKANDPAPKAWKTPPKACKSCTEKCAKAKKAEAKTAKAADKPKHKPRTEAQKARRRELAAMKRAAAKKTAEKKADASGSKTAVKIMLEIGGVNKNVADLYGCIMGKVIDVVSTEIKHLINAMDDVISKAKKK